MRLIGRADNTAKVRIINQTVTMKQSIRKRERVVEPTRSLSMPRIVWKQKCLVSMRGGGIGRARELLLQEKFHMRKLWTPIGNSNGHPFRDRKDIGIINYA